MRYCKKKKGEIHFPPLPTAKCYFCSCSKATQPIMDTSDAMAYTAQNSALVNTSLRVVGVAIHTVATNGPNTSHTVVCAHSIIIPILRKMFSIIIKFKGLHPIHDIEIKKRGNLFPPFLSQLLSSHAVHVPELICIRSYLKVRQIHFSAVDLCFKL